MAFKDNSVSARSVAPTNVMTAKQSSAYRGTVQIHFTESANKDWKPNEHIQLSSLTHRTKLEAPYKVGDVTPP